MRRLFWLSLGASLAVLIMRKLSRAAEKLTPQNLAASLGTAITDLAATIGEFGADVRAAMNTREQELRVAAGLDGASVERVVAPPSDIESAS